MALPPGQARMAYIPPPRRVPPPVVRRVPPPQPQRYGAPEPPNFQAFLAELAASMPNRSDADMNTLLNERIAPFTSAIDASTNAARAANEYRLETKAGVNEGLSSAFLKMLTGGQAGDAGSAYAKENFGGSYLPGQVISMAADQLRTLTSDFDEGDWKITGQYMEAMQQIPGIREELRAQVEKGDLDDYEQKVKTATLLMDETWRAFATDRATWEYDTGRADTKAEAAKKLAEEKRQFDEQIRIAKGELGIEGVNAQTGAVKAATGARNADIRARELELKRAKQQYTKAKDKVAQQQAQERINVAKGNLEVARLRAETAAKPKPKAGEAKPKPLTAAKKQELSQIAFDTASDDFQAGTKPVETLRDLIAAGVPFAIAIRAIQRYGKDPTADPYWVATLGWKK